jgi:TldD protein
MQHTPNLTLEPGPKEQGLEELIASLDNGVVVEQFSLFSDGKVDMDFQVLNGVGSPNKITEVRKGKRVARLLGEGSFMFRSPELWKHVKAIGGPQSVERLYRCYSTKGEPEQQAPYSVSAVPALITDVALIDLTRKA